MHFIINADNTIIPMQTPLANVYGLPSLPDASEGLDIGYKSPNNVTIELINSVILFFIAYIIV